MHIEYLLDSTGRSSGAMFSAPLKEKILVFVFPTSAPRLFHTFFCPDLRMIALDEKGKFLFDDHIAPNRFVHLPKCKIVLETDPGVNVEPYLESILTKIARAVQFPQSGAWQAGVRVDALVFALLAEAVADLRRVKDAQRRGMSMDALRQHFEVWERGQIASSAGFILDFSRGYSVPPGALRLSRAVLQVEQPHLDELFAASVAGIPWHQEIQNTCLRCGRGGFWHFVLQAPPSSAVESVWRYLRPENAVPLCHRCVDTLELHKKAEVGIDLAWGLWGKRFEALWQWHRAFEGNYLPDWDRLTHPLWPVEFGGEAWETGSGALEHAAPRGPEGVQRTKAQAEALKRALFSKRIQKRHLANTPVWRLLELEEHQTIGGNL